MPSNQMSRRDYFKLLGAGSVYAASAMSFGCKAEASEKKQEEKLAPQESEAAEADRVRRMQWWHDAKFGMSECLFIGAYTVCWAVTNGPWRRKAFPFSSMSSWQSDLPRSQTLHALGRNLPNKLGRNTW